MWDDEGNEALFDQSGDFRDQEEFERFVEEYTPLPSLGSDEIDDVANTVNVDFERIGNTYLGAGHLRFNTDFEAKISAIWHFWRSPGMQTFKASIDPLTRAAIRDYYRQTDSVHGNGHPETCGCPECHLLYTYLEYALRSLDSDETAARPRQPDSNTPQRSPEPVQPVPAPSTSFAEQATPPDAPSIPPSSQIRMSSEPRHLGWFARLVRPWSWLRRQR